MSLVSISNYRGDILKESLRKAIAEAIKSFRDDLHGEEVPSILIEIPKNAKFGFSGVRFCIL